MKVLLKSVSVALFVMFAAVAVASVAPAKTASAQDEEAEQNQEQTESENETTYSYTAQAGDSYTKMARKAVQTYGLVEEVNLSQAAIIYAETELTRAAGSPVLNIGENVSMKESDVAAVVEKAKNLNESQLSGWETYVPYVNFNTDNVGEVRS